MLNLDCYKEKCGLIAYYFCDKQRVTVTPNTVFELWNCWWNTDFKRKGHLLYKCNNGRLVHNKDDADKDEALLKECNKVFQHAYKWIDRYVEKHTKIEIQNSVMQQRIRYLAELKSLAAKKNLKVVMCTQDVKSSKLARYKVKGNGFSKEGNYARILEYLQEI